LRNFYQGERVKVGVLTSVHTPFDVRIFHKECRSLVQADHHVTVIGPHSHDEVVGGIRIKAVKGSRTSRAARVTLTVARVAAEALRLDAAVYHLHDPELIPVGLMLRQLGKLVVYDAHEDLPQTIASKRYVPPVARRPLEKLSGALEHVAARRLSAVVAATPTIANRFAATNPRTIVVRNFVCLEEWQSRFQMSWNERPCAVAYVGLISWDRGLREMVEAMACLPGRLSARLVLAGPRSPGLMREARPYLAEGNQLDDMGVLDRPQVAAVLGRVRAGLVILHPTPNYVASLPIKLFEYMAAGLPVVVSDFPVLRSIVDAAGCGLLVDPLNIHAIARAIQFLLEHPDQAQAMGRRGREAVERTYNWESEARKLVHLYAELESAEPNCR
jgi:glycosyltransferase involved in cell wall biosynthesis